MAALAGCYSYEPSNDSSQANRSTDESAMARQASATDGSYRHLRPVQPIQRVSTAPAVAQPQQQPQPSPQRALSDAAAGKFVLAFPTGDRATSIILIEQTGEPQVRVNRPYEYRVTVTNLTDAMLSDVDVRERVPKWFRIESSDPPASPDGDGQPHWLLGEFGPREKKTITVTAVPGRVGALAGCLSVTYSPTLCTSTEIINPELRLTKDGPRQVDLCEPLVYHYVIRNVGVGPARNVKIEDPLPDGLRTEEGGRTVAVDVGVLRDGEERVYNIGLKAQRTGEFSTQAVAHADQGLQAQTPTLSTAVRAPQLSVSVKLPPRQFVDKSVTAQAVITNRGDAPARDAVLRIDASHGARLLLPMSPSTSTSASTSPSAGIASASASDVPATAPAAAIGSTSPDTPDRRSLGTIDPGQSRTVNIVLRGTLGGDVKLTATATCVCASPAADSASIFIQTLPALMLECVDSVDPVPVGEETTYTITVKNQGSGIDKNVRVVATLPEEETFISAKGVTGVKRDGRTLTFEPVAALAPGETVTWKVAARAERAADVRFRVELSSDWLTRPAVKEESTRLY
jgi:uncharacterized repeat protein (TIGR01451 family)